MFLRKVTAPLKRTAEYLSSLMQSAGASSNRDPWVRRGAVLLFSLLLLIPTASATLVNADPPQQADQAGESFTVNTQVDSATNLLGDQITSFYEPLNSQLVITIKSPENKGYASTAIRLLFTIEPANTFPIWIAYRLDNAQSVTISSNTTIRDLPAGAHIILLYARDNNDNIVQSNTVYFTLHPGDIVGDGEVDIFDLQRLAWAFLAQPTDPSWNEAADLNCDYTVNVVDLQLFAWNFGNEYTL